MTRQQALTILNARVDMVSHRWRLCRHLDLLLTPERSPHMRSLDRKSLLERTILMIRRTSKGITLTRQNYEHFADAAVKQLIKTVPLEQETVSQLWRQSQHTNTSDWLDLACFRVACQLRKHLATHG